jgi:hypothetical protein
MASVPPRHTGCVGSAAVRAGNEALERETLAKVLARGRFGFTRHALKDFLVRLKADKRVVLALRNDTPHGACST